MNENIDIKPRGRKRLVLISGLLATMLFVMAFQVIMAQEIELLPPDLSNSTKLVDKDQALAGSVLNYTIVISNSGNGSASVVNLTDTLDMNLDYLSGGISSGGGLYGESGGVITWTGGVNVGTQVVIEFTAQILSGVISGTEVVNTATIGYEGPPLILGPTITTIISPSVIVSGPVFLPIIFKPLPPPPIVTLNPIGRPNVSNQWTVNWSVSDPTYVTNYEVQEDHHPSFSNPNTINVPAPNTSVVRSLSASPSNIYYYRVRAIAPSGSGDWSNIQQVVGNYLDDFSNDTTGWAMRRQDTDTVANQVYYRNGNLVLEMDSGYDYLIAAPMAPAPQMPYKIETSVQLVGVDNLHSYGIIFGGDWDGTECPNQDYSSCFNQYYRLALIWSGNSDNRMTMILKRIDYHDPGDNAGRGPNLIGPRFVSVNYPPSSYQVWTVEVYPTGLIKIFVNGNFVDEIVDTSYINRPFFGAFSSVDEYTGIEAEFDWFAATVLP